jgi:hypothetical protein
MNYKSRDYDKPDDKMLQQAQTMQGMFDKNKSDFIAHYIQFADPFSSDFQSDIESAHALPLADEEIANLKVATEDLEMKMEEARDHFQLFSSYVRLLFPDSQAKRDLFGLGKYPKAYNSALRMYELLIFANKKADSAEYNGALIALGFEQTAIDKLATLADEIFALKEIQEELKVEQKIRTENRIVAFNKVWGYMKAVSHASKTVYATNYTMLQIFKLYPGGRRKPKPAMEADVQDSEETESPLEE